MPPQHQFNRNKVLKELQEHNSFFDDFVDMIPAKLYVSGGTGDDMYNPKFFKGQHKESKEARRARNKVAKLAKFDPERAETTLQAKKRKEEEDEMEDSSDDENDMTMMNDENDEDEQVRSPKNSKDKRGKKAGFWANGNDGNSDADETDNVDKKKKNSHINQSSIETLREKLHAKIAEKRALRPENEDNSAVISKRAARRAEKKRRYEAKKKSNEIFSKVNESSKRAKKIEMGGTKINTAITANNNGKSKTEDLSGIDFGGLAGLKKIPTFQDNKSLANTNGKNKKSLNALLALAQKKKERLEELKAGTEEEKEKAKKMIWGDTLKAATGEKNMSDPALLKKALKRKAKKKNKSQESWKARMEQVKDKMDERQKIRSHNLGKRKLGGAAGANLSSKRIEDEAEKESTTKKRPRLGPHAAKGRVGFEGKKQEFINGKNKKKDQ